MPSFLLGLLILAGAIIALTLLYIGSTLLLSRVPAAARPGNGAPVVTAYLITSGVHIDLVLPTSVLPANFLRQAKPSPGAKFIAFGWGDKGFYLETPTWAELKPSVAAKAMLIKSPTVMHLTDYFQEEGSWYPIPLREDQLSDIIAYLMTGFQMNEINQLIEIPGTGYTDHDRFFEGHGSYHCFMTCNTWINRGLKRAGVRTAVWAAHEAGVLRYFQPYAQAIPSA